MTSKKSSTKTLIISLLAFLILATGSNQEVQETITYYTGLEKDFTEYIQGNKKVLGANVETAKVNRVIDGDTIVLEDGRTIRLLNVDTPETKKPGVPIMCYGTESSKFLTALLEERQVQLIKDEESTDRYGRDLRFVYLDGKT
ncbi:hypothetical protein HC766_00145 [Candidatus Gracilibacteria bacterium]|nr:hypothetical protein [Candidatus Gracilibacteria bacterium]